jgi:hypothetical protein
MVMKCHRIAAALFAGVLLAALPGCRGRSSEAPTAAGTTTAAPAPATQSAAAVATPAPPVVTADPVLASQRNARRRREARAKPKEASSAQAAPAAPAPAPEPAAPVEHVVPQGTILRVTFDRAISTATAQAGETIPGKLLDALIAADGTVLAASGTPVQGRVESAVPSGRLGGTAELRLTLASIRPGGGPELSIQTTSFEQKGETHAKRNAGYIAGGAAVGALLGQLIGGDTGSTIGGAAAGAAAGTGVAAATGKLDIEIEAGRTVAFELAEPLRMTTKP